MPSFTQWLQRLRRTRKLVTADQFHERERKSLNGRIVVSERLGLLYLDDNTVATVDYLTALPRDRNEALGVRPDQDLIFFLSNDPYKIG